MTTHKHIEIATLMQTSGVQFGTSGARGLVSAMTDEVCFAYTVAFIEHLKQQGTLTDTGFSIAIAGDLRSSTPRIMQAIAAAIKDNGGQPINCGHIPSPAVAYFALQKRMPSIMVTGSHIPEDRNGIKFNTPTGEISKLDEAGMRNQCVALPNHMFDQAGMFTPTYDAALPELNPDAYDNYVARYLSFFPKSTLAGKTIGLYEHSSVGRDIFHDILSGLGANVVRLARSDIFVSVDTEAIRPEDVSLAKSWAQQQPLDAIISADGDADRPLVSDEHGCWIRGDVSGILTAQYLGATFVATPVSSNSAVEKCGFFETVARTRIGSPYVIEAMEQAHNSEGVIGYEANGGFLVGSPIISEHGTLRALPTRDAILVPLALISLATQKGLTLSQLVTTLPARFTASDRAKNFPTEKSQDILTSLTAETAANDFSAIEALFKSHFGPVKGTNTTDGLRITFNNDEVVHLRPSGNAPEFRCYNEASSVQRAEEMNRLCMQLIESWK